MAALTASVALAVPTRAGTISSRKRVTKTFNRTHVLAPAAVSSSLAPPPPRATLGSTLTTWLLKEEIAGRIDGELAIVLSSIALACKQIASTVRDGSAATKQRGGGGSEDAGRQSQRCFLRRAANQRPHRRHRVVRCRGDCNTTTTTTIVHRYTTTIVHRYNNSSTTITTPPGTVTNRLICGYVPCLRRTMHRWPWRRRTTATTWWCSPHWQGGHREQALDRR